MHRRLLVLLALVVALALAYGVWARAWDDPSPPPTAPSPVLPAPSDDLAAPPADAIRLRIDVSPRERFVPPPAARVVGLRAPGGERVPATIVAGAGAGFDANAGDSGAALAAFLLPEGRVLRQVALRDGVTEVWFAARLVVHGTVRDGTGKPFPGAIVWFGEHDADGSRREFVTDADGSYTATVLAGDGVPFVVTAAGCAAQWRAVAVGMPPPRCDAVLERAAVLDVQLAATAVELATARLFVVPTGQVGSALAQWPFFVQALTDGFPFDDNGRARVADLPAGCTVGLLVCHPLAPLAAPRPVALRGERVREVVPVAFAATTWRGLVVDEAGDGLAGALLWARDVSMRLEPGNSQRLLPPNLGLPGAMATSSDRDGAFAVGAIGGPGAGLSLRAHGRAGRDLPAAVVESGQPLVLPAWHGGQATLVVPPPRRGVAWVVEGYSGTRALAPGETWIAALPHEGIFDVGIAAFLGDREVGRVVHKAVVATGPVTVVAPELPQ